METENSIYNSAGYCRASKEDGDKPESNTIGNQKAMIEEFAKRHPDIRLREMITDDGQSGVSFDEVR